MHTRVALEHSAEELLVGCLLDDPSILGKADIRPGLWCDERCRTVWEFLLRCRKAAPELDSIRFQSELMRSLPGLVHWAMGLLTAIPTSESWPYWLGLARENAASRHRRSLARSLEKAEAVGELEKLHQKLGVLVQIQTEILEKRERGPLLLPPPDPTVLAVSRAMAGLDAQLMGKEGAIGIPTHLPTFNTLTGGFKKGELVIVAARPGEGKTTLALNLLNGITRNERTPSSFVSLEMPSEELIVNLGHLHARVPRSGVARRTLTQEQCSQLAQSLTGIVDLRVRFHERTLTLTSIEKALGEDVGQNGTKVAFVDYLQRIRVPEQKDRWLAVAETSNRLKTLAMELGITIVALAQLSRTPEQEGRTPRLSDLRGSAEIEADADVVAILHKDKTGTLEMNLVKVRRGSAGKVRLRTEYDLVRMDEITEVPDLSDAP